MTSRTFAGVEHLGTDRRLEITARHDGAHIGALRLHFQEGFAAAQLRQAEIAHHQADLVAVRLEQLDCFNPVFRGKNMEAFAFQDRDAELAQHLFVFDEKNRLRNVLPARTGVGIAAA
jgi:hypothetical protein